MNTVFITGATRGIGLELCKKMSSMGFKVYMGCRSLEKAQKALQEIDNNTNIIPIVIDVGLEESVKKGYEEYLKIKEVDESLDLLINNAASQLDWSYDGSYTKTFDIDIETLDRIFRVNTFGPLLTTKYFLPSMKNGTRIVNVVSGAGLFWHHSACMDYQVGYASSKAALIMLTKKMAAALKEKEIYVNACSPGWCKTSMGGKEAPDSPEVGANSIIKTCFLGEIAPTGLYFSYGKRICIETMPQNTNNDCKNCAQGTSFLQKLFSVINENDHKVVRLLGIKMKFKNLRRK